MEIKRENAELAKEQKELMALLKSEEKMWLKISDEISEIKAKFGAKNPLGKRRTDFAEAPSGMVIDIEAFIEKEPITILMSKMGWIRSLKGHVTDIADVKYKEGDEERFQLTAQTTDKLLLFATDGRFYTLGCDKLPRGKGAGEPVRLMIDMPAEVDIASVRIYNENEKLLLAASNGKGFIVDSVDVVASTKNGKQILNPIAPANAEFCIPVEGDSVAIIGTNRKLLVFPISQIPPMKKGQGVTLQKYKESEISDIKTFTLKDGLSWQLGGRVRLEMDLKPWQGNRADAGRLPPTGFPRENKF